MIKNKVLVVDDIPANRKLLRRMIDKMIDCDVVEATNGREAIEAFKAESLDLILMDINMPEMDGYHAASIIKELAGENYIPIIFVTALNTTESLTTSISSGGDDYISKPFDTAVLKSKINAHLRIRELNQQLNIKNTELHNANQYLRHEQELVEYFFNSALEQSFLDEKYIKYHMSSMSSFNGDIFLVARRPHGGLNIIMGDFTGHGLSAAMGTLPVVMVFFKMVSLNSTVADIARELNFQLNKLLPTSMFFSATVIELNPQGNILTAWAGGMPECYWIDNNGDLKGSIKSKHMPLGILHDSGFDSGTEIFSVADNDKFYLYSDGVTEAHRPNGEMFGDERFKNILVTSEGDRIAAVLNVLNDFLDGSGQTDDLTLVELSCHESTPPDQPEKTTQLMSCSLPWSLSVSLAPSDMRLKEPVMELSNLLGSLPVTQHHQGALEVLLSEIYFNALEYSILDMGDIAKENEQQFEEYYKIREKKLAVLDDAFINFNFNYLPNKDGHTLSIHMEDSGCGYKGHVAEFSTEKLHGRGLGIIDDLCESVEFSDDGTILDLIYKL